MKHIDRQKQIERHIKEINERAFKNSLKPKTKRALFIDPVPDSFLNRRALDQKKQMAESITISLPDNE